jgi:hypothetical protein
MMLVDTGVLPQQMAEELAQRKADAAAAPRAPAQ